MKAFKSAVELTNREMKEQIDDSYRETTEKLEEVDRKLQKVDDTADVMDRIMAVIDKQKEDIIAYIDEKDELINNRVTNMYEQEFLGCEKFWGHNHDQYKHMKNFVSEKLMQEDLKMGNEIDSLTVAKERNQRAFTNLKSKYEKTEQLLDDTVEQADKTDVILTSTKEHIGVHDAKFIFDIKCIEDRMDDAVNRMNAVYLDDLPKTIEKNHRDIVNFKTEITDRLDGVDKTAGDLKAVATSGVSSASINDMFSEFKLKQTRINTDHDREFMRVGGLI
jgi:hypothetical protein